MTDLVLIDGPNLFNTVGRYLKEAIRTSSVPFTQGDGLTDYFLSWFDFDRFASASLCEDLERSSTLGTVIFHSRKPLGGSGYRIENADLTNFWGRQGSNPNTSAFEVLIPGEQKEKGSFHCKACGAHNEGESTSEKGVDASVIVYMFESMLRWDSLCIFSRDSDYVPAVWALRRIGKRVFAAGEEAAAQSPLGRAAQNFYPLPLEWCAVDYEAFRWQRPGGILDRVLAKAAPGKRRVMLGSSYLDIWTTSDGRAELVADLSKEVSNGWHEVASDSLCGVRTTLPSPARPRRRLLAAWEGTRAAVLAPNQFND